MLALPPLLENVRFFAPTPVTPREEVNVVTAPPCATIVAPPVVPAILMILSEVSATEPSNLSEPVSVLLPKLTVPTFPR